MKSKKHAILMFALICISASQVRGGEVDQANTYLKQLEAISHIEGNGNNELLTLIRMSCSELEKSWSLELAKEVARVFNELMNVNQNYFLVELIEPVITKYPEKFKPILDASFSDKNKKLYLELVDMHRREQVEGNG